MWLLILLMTGTSLAYPMQDTAETDGNSSRKVLGSSVVTSVSVILDTGNNSQPFFTDSVGKPVPKPMTAAQLASPINLLNPDRYEFYTFDDNGDLVKRLMTLEEIQSIIANGDGDFNLSAMPEKRVDDVVTNVQNVLKGEIESHNPDNKPILDTPDVSSTWSMILPTIFSNSGDDVKADQIQAQVALTPDTIMIETESPIETTTKIVKTPTTEQPVKQEFVTFFSVEDSKQKPLTTTETSIVEKKTTNNVVSTTPAAPTKEQISPVTSTTSIDIQTPTPSNVFINQINLNSAHITSTNMPHVHMAPENLSTHKPVYITRQPLPLSTKTDPTKTSTLPLASTTMKDEKNELSTDFPANTKPAIGSEKNALSSIFAESSSDDAFKEVTSTEGTEMNFKITQTIPSENTQTSSVNNNSLPPIESSTKQYTTLITESTVKDSIVTVKPTVLAPTNTEPIKITSTETSIRPQVTLNSNDVSQDSTEELKTSASENVRPIATSTVSYRPIIYILTTPENSPSQFITATKNDALSFSILPTTEKFTNEKTSTEENNATTPAADENSKTTNQMEVETTPNYENFSNATEVIQKEITTEGEELTTPSLNLEENLTVTELLNQLLESTDIYEINSQLSDVTQKTTQENFKTTEYPDVGEIDVSSESSEIASKENFEEAESSHALGNIVADNALKDMELPTTTKHEVTTNKIDVTYETTPVAYETTTDVQLNISTIQDRIDVSSETTIIDNVDQLISQAVNNIMDVPMQNEKEAQKVHDVMLNSSSKPMEKVQVEAATIASMLLDNRNADSNNSTVIKDLPLSESVNSLISQVVESKMPALTNINALQTTTEGVTEHTTQNFDEIEKTPEPNTNNDGTNITQTNYRTEVPHDVHVIIYRTTQASASDNIAESSTFKPIIALEELNSNKKDAINSKVDDNLYKNNDVTTEATKDNDKQEKVDNSKKHSEAVIRNVATKPKETNSKEEFAANSEVNKISNNDDKELLPAKSDVDLKENSQIEIEKGDTVTSTENFISTTDFQTFTMEPNASTLESDEGTTLRDFMQTGTNEDTSQGTTDTIVDATTGFETTTVKIEGTTEALIKTTDQGSPVSTTEISKMSTAQASTTVSSGTINFNIINKSPVPSSPTPFTAAPPRSTKKPVETPENSSERNNSNTTTWTLVPVVSPNSNATHKPVADVRPSIPNIEPAKPVDLIPQPLQGFGLEDSTANLDTDVYKFVELCNELAFSFWQTVTTGISSARSAFTSPFAATSLLAMVFLGARGSTSGEMNEILKLDDMVTFNPHLIFRNVSESIEVSPSAGVATSAIIRELYSDKSKGKLLNFYKERARQFYDGHVEEASFREISDVIRRRTNLLVKRQTWGKIPEYVKDVQITARPPLAGISASIFQTDCSAASTEGRDGELYFVVLPTIRQRRLVPVPAVVYRSGFLAGYDPGLDATAVALGSKDQTVSTIFVIPGQQGIAAPGDGLARLEKYLTDSAVKRGSWTRLLRSLIPRPGLEVQIPRFSHRSIINATVALQKMGLKDLFDSKKADLRGLNGVAHELHLSDLLQINTFATCGEGPIEDTHHSEIYPATAARPSRQSRKLDHLMDDYETEHLEEPRDYQRAFHDPLHDPSFLALPLSLRPRQARLPEVPRLRFDRPFLYVVRHNPTGLILHMGRFNPRLLP